MKQYNLTQIESQTWEGFFDYLGAMWSMGETYHNRELYRAINCRIRCWDMPYVLDVVNYVDIPTDTVRKTTIQMLRQDELVGFDLKMYMFQMKGKEDCGYWCAWEGDMDAFTVLGKFTSDPEGILACPTGSDSTNNNRSFADFRKFLQALEEALVRMVLMPAGSDIFFRTWKNYFVHHSYTVDELAYLKAINGEKFSP